MAAIRAASGAEFVRDSSPPRSVDCHVELAAADKDSAGMVVRFRFPFAAFCAAFLVAGASLARADGREYFSNFPETGSTYANGTFLGQDGSTWTYLQCRGNKVIQAPTPGLNDGTPLAFVGSSNLVGGCGTLSFDWMQMFTTTVSVDVVVNDVVLHTVSGSGQNVTNHAGPLDVHVGGIFSLAIRQHSDASGQVAIDNVEWTSYDGSALPPTVAFEPTNADLVAPCGNLFQFAVKVAEPNGDEVRLWAAGLPAGAAFNAVTGLAPFASTFSWTPAEAQTGKYDVVFCAGDKDGTNSRTCSIEVTPVYPYYYAAEGLSGAALRAALHAIVTNGAVQLDNDGEDAAMKEIHTDPNNTNNVLLLYNPTSSVPKTLYDDPGGWNKEHCWAQSRNLSGDGPDQVDVHNLYAEDTEVNRLRGALFYDESNPADSGFCLLSTNLAPQTSPLTSMDSDSWEPPPASKGNVARAVFYMAVRYDGSETGGPPLELSDTPDTNQMGVLTTLLAWHAADPPDLMESNRNETIYATYQHNRNPFIDHPEWVEEIWGTNNVPPQFVPLATQQVAVNSRLAFEVRALPTGGDPVALSMSNAPAGAAFYPTNAAGTFVWTPTNAGAVSVDFYATDNDGTAHQSVRIEVSEPTQSIVLVRYDFEDAATNFTPAPSQCHVLLSATDVTGSAPPLTNSAGSPGRAISDSGWNVADLSAYFAFSVAVSNGHELVPTRLSFSEQASSSGPKNWQIRSSLDGYATSLGGGSTHTAFASNAVNFSGLSLTNGSVVFRIYGTNATLASGTWRLDNLRLSGYLQTFSDGNGDDDGDGMSNADEAVAGTDPANSNSLFEASISGTQIVCGLLASGSVWRLYEGVYGSNDIVWTPIAETDRLQGGILRFDVVPSNPATFYHLRALRP